MIYKKLFLMIALGGTLFLPSKAKFTYDDIKNSKEDGDAPKLAELIFTELKLNKELKISNNILQQFIYFSLEPTQGLKLSALRTSNIKVNESKRIEIKKQLAGNYKIHLMPETAKDITTIISRLLQKMNNDQELRKSIITFKVRSNLDFPEGEVNVEQLKTSAGIVPIIVIYAANGKEYAQYVLDTVYQLFGTMKGLDKFPPRFNKKITSLIYYAQGNGDDKILLDADEYFTEDRVFYKPDFVEPVEPGEIVGVGNPYELKDPATEKMAPFTYNDIKNNKISLATELAKSVSKELELKKKLDIFDDRLSGNAFTYFNLEPSKEANLTGLRVSDIQKAKNPTRVKMQLAGNYKIHLMPQSDQDLIDIISTLLRTIDTDNKLNESIITFKVKNNLDFTKSALDIIKQLKHHSSTLPIVVIYASNGKKYAQYVLDTVYKLFGTMQGLNEAPRFNKEITSLIYYAQGNGDDKDDDNAEYFTKDRIFYKPDFVESGEMVDYQLNNPVNNPALSEKEQKLHEQNRIKHLKEEQVQKRKELEKIKAQTTEQEKKELQRKQERIQIEQKKKEEQRREALEKLKVQKEHEEELRSKRQKKLLKKAHRHQKLSNNLLELRNSLRLLTVALPRERVTYKPLQVVPQKNLDQSLRMLKNKLTDLLNQL